VHHCATIFENGGKSLNLSIALGYLTFVNCSGDFFAHFRHNYAIFLEFCMFWGNIVNGANGFFDFSSNLGIRNCLFLENSINGLFSGNSGLKNLVIYDCVFDLIGADQLAGLDPSHIWNIEIHRHNALTFLSEISNRCHVLVFNTGASNITPSTSITYGPDLVFGARVGGKWHPKAAAPLNSRIIVNHTFSTPSKCCAKFRKCLFLNLTEGKLSYGGAIFVRLVTGDSYLEVTACEFAECSSSLGGGVYSVVDGAKFAQTSVIECMALSGVFAYCNGGVNGVSFGECSLWNCPKNELSEDSVPAIIRAYHMPAQLIKTNFSMCVKHRYEFGLHYEGNQYNPIVSSYVTCTQCHKFGFGIEDVPTGYTFEFGAFVDSTTDRGWFWIKGSRLMVRRSVFVRHEGVVCKIVTGKCYFMACESIEGFRFPEICFDSVECLGGTYGALLMNQIWEENYGTFEIEDSNFSVSDMDYSMPWSVWDSHNESENLSLSECWSDAHDFSNSQNILETNAGGFSDNFSDSSFAVNFSTPYSATHGFNSSSNITGSAYFADSVLFSPSKLFSTTGRFSRSLTRFSESSLGFGESRIYDDSESLPDSEGLSEALTSHFPGQFSPSSLLGVLKAEPVKMSTEQIVVVALGGAIVVVAAVVVLVSILVKSNPKPIQDSEERKEMTD
jgi:hypothetical protein